MPLVRESGDQASVSCAGMKKYDVKYSLRDEVSCVFSLVFRKNICSFPIGTISNNLWDNTFQNIPSF